MFRLYDSLGEEPKNYDFRLLVLIPMYLDFYPASHESLDHLVSLSRSVVPLPSLDKLIEGLVVLPPERGEYRSNFDRIEGSIADAGNGSERCHLIFFLRRSLVVCSSASKRRLADRNFLRLFDFSTA